ncbi:N-methylhydantoinase A [Hyphomicrobiales bacterium]|nr:N-methylhydantoinase A [Hyphomicrobiales bacterium]
MQNAIEIGIDIGGTFTDVVSRDRSGIIRLLKVPTTRGNESVAVRQAIAAMLDICGVEAAAVSRFVHGTTVATNAILERKSAKTGLLTTQGFRDVFEIGRQYRQNMYDLRLKPSAPTFLLPGHLRKEVRERVDAHGRIVTPLDESSVETAVRELMEEGVEAIAVSFLFSFLEPRHEQMAGDIIRRMAPNMAVSLSCDVDPTFREFERTCVTAFDACVKPVMRRYIAAMQSDLEEVGVGARLQIIQSRGGLAAAETAAERPVRLFLSGPAAGVIGGQAVGEAAGIADLIAIDVGGTSTDISVITGSRPAVRQDGLIDGFAVRVPMVDVNAIGAGGGSIAWIDGAGGLRLGPHSAGAVPGPACYGRGGTEPTVTDASVVLGYIDPEFFAGGRLSLQPDLAFEAVAKIAKSLGLSTEEAALGIHRVANGQMAEGVRLMSVKRGIDPRPYALLCLGGGGSLHGVAVAEEMGIARVVVPPFPGVLSAYGLLSAPIEHEATAAFGKTVAETSPAEFASALSAIDARCAALMAREGSHESISVGHAADVCYVGQSHTIEIALSDISAEAISQIQADFVEAHHRVYGHATDSPARIVNLRSVHRVVAASQPWPDFQPSAKPARKGSREVLLPGTKRRTTVAIWDRSALKAGDLVQGPSIVEQEDTTTLVGAGWTGHVTEEGNLILSVNEEGKR